MAAARAYQRLQRAHGSLEGHPTSHAPRPTPSVHHLLACSTTDTYSFFAAFVSCFPSLAAAAYFFSPRAFSSASFLAALQVDARRQSWSESGAADVTLTDPSLELKAEL